jgi:predicted lipoprotein with Yx(FWY)xxD motif
MRTYRNCRLPRALGTLVAVLLAILTLSSYGTASASGAGATPGRSAFRDIGAAKATGKTLSLAKGKQGIFAIGPNGHSLYVFDGDHGTKSGCTGSCASTWLAFTDKGAITTGVLINKSEVAKADGQKPDQLTFYGHLLYYFKGDTAPGQTNGVGTPGWHLIGPFGNVMLPRG